MPHGGYGDRLLFGLRQGQLGAADGGSLRQLRTLRLHGVFPLPYRGYYKERDGGGSRKGYCPHAEGAALLGLVVGHALYHRGQLLLAAAVAPGMLHRGKELLEAEGFAILFHNRVSFALMYYRHVREGYRHSLR